MLVDLQTTQTYFISNLNAIYLLKGSQRKIGLTSQPNGRASVLLSFFVPLSLQILPFRRHPSPISTYYAVLASRNRGIWKFLQFLVIFMWNLELCFSIIDTQVSALTEAAEFCIPVNLGVDLLPAHVYGLLHEVGIMLKLLSLLSICKNIRLSNPIE